MAKKWTSKKKPKATDRVLYHALIPRVELYFWNGETIYHRDSEQPMRDAIEGFIPQLSSG